MDSPVSPTSYKLTLISPAYVLNFPLSFPSLILPPHVSAACFASACNAVAMQQNITLPEDLVVESTVALCGDMKKLDIFLEVELKVKTPEGIEKSTMQEIVSKAEKVCPYSKVSRRDVILSFEGGSCRAEAWTCFRLGTCRPSLETSTSRSPSSNSDRRLR